MSTIFKSGRDWSSHPMFYVRTIWNATITFWSKKSSRLENFTGFVIIILYKIAKISIRPVYSHMIFRTPRDTITWVGDQMKLLPVKFLRLTQLTYFINRNLLMFNEILVVSKSLNHHRITNEIYDLSISKTKKIILKIGLMIKNGRIKWTWTYLQRFCRKSLEWEVFLPGHDQE